MKLETSQLKEEFNEKLKALKDTNKKLKKKMKLCTCGKVKTAELMDSFKLENQKRSFGV